MADFKFNVSDNAYRRLGIRPVIDENLYGELIDTHAPESPYFEIAVVPTAFWPGRNLAQRLMDIQAGATLSPAGGYSGKRELILLPTVSNPCRSNKLLIHETKHLIDKANGDSQESLEAMKHSLKGALALAGSEVLLSVTEDDSRQAVLSGLSALSLMPMIYWNSLHEVAARRFAADKDIQARYGEIFTYEDI